MKVYMVILNQTTDLFNSHTEMEDVPMETDVLDETYLIGTYLS